MLPTGRDLIDALVGELDAALRTMAGVAADGGRTGPAAGVPDEGLSQTDRDRAAQLMRVNHAGEIAAQALYRGQALVARDAGLRDELLRAAGEEHDHLRWCAARTRELGAEVSRLTPAWYAGSLAIGVAAGLAGDRVSLGFLAETERQVTEHLDGHLGRLPGPDRRSRAIVTQMRADEAEHRRNALARGGVGLPAPVRLGMRLAARFMTVTARFL
jgi:ubiquinone biosynthesis monooxygenase Coq7